MADQQQAGDYNGMVALILDVQQGASRQEVEYIDVSQIYVTPEFADTQVSYNELMDTISDIEGGRHVVKQPPPQPQRQVVQPTPPPPAEQAPAPEKKEKAKTELLGIVKRLAAKKSPIGEISRKKIDIGELVLPSLSTADQISELEKIIEGLRENVFDQEHLEVVANEVYGLKQVTAASHRGKPRRGGEQAELDQSLMELRDQRLDDAIALLNNIGAG